MAGALDWSTRSTNHMKNVIIDIVIVPSYFSTVSHLPGSRRPVNEETQHCFCSIVNDGYVVYTVAGI